MGWFLLGFIAFPITLMIWITGSENSKKRNFENDVKAEMKRIKIKEKKKAEENYEMRVRKEALKRLAEEKK